MKKKLKNRLKTAVKTLTKEAAPHLPFLTTLLGLSILFFMPFLAGNLSFLWDTREFGYTYFHEVSSSLSQWNFPLWNAENFSGYPFAGDIETSMFYPVQWLFALIFGALQFHELAYYFVFHFFLGGAFAYGLGYKLTKNRIAALTGAIVFAFSGYALGHISHLGQVTMYMWIPAVFWAFIVALEKKTFTSSLLAGLTFGISILVGHYNTSVYILLGLTILLIFNLIKDKSRRKIFTHFIISCVFAGMIASILALPVYELAMQSNRADLTYEQQSENWSLHPLDLSSLVAPNILNVLDDKPLENFRGSVDLTQNYLYIGILPLLLMIFAFFSKNKYKWFFIATGLIALLAAMGKYTPVNFFLFSFFPGFSKARMAVQILCIGFLSAAALSCIGMQHALSLIKDRKRLLPILGLLICVIVAGDIFYHGFDKRFYSEEIDPNILFDTQNELSLAKSLRENTPDEPFRISDEKGLVYGNRWAYHDIEQVWGLGGIKIKKYNDLFEQIEKVNAKPLTDNLYDFLNVKYVFTNRQLPFPHFKQTQEAEGDPVSTASDSELDTNKEFYINQTPLPRAYFVTDYIVEPNPENQLALIKDDQITFHKEVILPQEPKYFGEETSYKNTAEVEILEKTPSYLKIKASTPIPQILALSEISYPGWILKVDGKQHSPLTANYVFRAVPLNPGEHIVEFTYKPLSFRLGALISMLAILIFLACYSLRQRLSLTAHDKD